MIEANAFLAMFMVQILAMSVVLPAWFIRYARLASARVPTERFAQLYPDVDFAVAQGRFLTRYRAVNTAIAVLGLFVMGWLFSYTRRLDWDDGPVEALVGAYFAFQALPMCVITWLGIKYKKIMLERSLPDAKRKASLQRRSLFDFVSPFTVAVAVAGYFLFVGYAIYLERNPFPGFAGALVNIGIITAVYALEAFCVYTLMYGKKINPLETHAGSEHTIAVGVRCCIYACIAAVVFTSINFTLVMLDLQRWEPFTLSVFLVICALLSVSSLTAPSSPDGDGFGPDRPFGRRAPDPSV